MKMETTTSFHSLSSTVIGVNFTGHNSSFTSESSLTTSSFSTDNSGKIPNTNDFRISVATLSRDETTTYAKEASTVSQSSVTGSNINGGLSSIAVLAIAISVTGFVLLILLIALLCVLFKKRIFVKLKSKDNTQEPSSIGERLDPIGGRDSCLTENEVKTKVPYTYKSYITSQDSVDPRDSGLYTDVSDNTIVSIDNVIGGQTNQSTHSTLQWTSANQDLNPERDSNNHHPVLEWTTLGRPGVFSQNITDENNMDLSPISNIPTPQHGSEDNIPSTKPLQQTKSKPVNAMKELLENTIYKKRKQVTEQSCNNENSHQTSIEGRKHDIEEINRHTNESSQTPIEEIYSDTATNCNYDVYNIVNSSSDIGNMPDYDDVIIPNNCENKVQLPDSCAYDTKIVPYDVYDNNDGAYEYVDPNNVTNMIAKPIENRSRDISSYQARVRTNQRAPVARMRSKAGGKKTKDLRERESWRVSKSSLYNEIGAFDPTIVQWREDAPIDTPMVKPGMALRDENKPFNYTNQESKLKMTQTTICKVCKRKHFPTCGAKSYKVFQVQM